MDHEQAFQLREAHSDEWGQGVRAAMADLENIRALTPAEAVAVAARHYSVGGFEAAAYWGGYAAGIVRYERVPGMTVVTPPTNAQRAQLTAVKHEEIAAEVARGEHRDDERDDD